MRFKKVAKLVVTAAVLGTTLVASGAGPAGACEGNESAPTFRVSLWSTKSAYALGSKAVIGVNVERDSINAPAKDVNVSVYLTQRGRATGASDKTDDLGRARIAVPLKWLRPGFVDVHVYASTQWAQVPCYGRVGESGRTYATDMFRIVRP